MFYFDRDNALCYKLYDKRDDFNFDIVNFPFLCSNIPSSPAYGVYISQLVRYSRTCKVYGDFKNRHLELVTRLLAQGFTVTRLRRAFNKFHRNYGDAFFDYGKSKEEMAIDAMLFEVGCEFGCFIFQLLDGQRTY